MTVDIEVAGATSEAAEFLEKLRPGGPWCLTFIVPDGTATTKTFHDAQQAGCEALAANARANVYYMPNRTITPLSKKASKSDVLAMDFLWVDVDPRAGEDFEAERERILALVTARLPAGIPQPTVIVDSGGGFNVLWRLVEPLAIDGDETKASEAERYNKALEREFGADNCGNCDRILRLPGLTNWPNKVKRAKGRTATPAKVHSWPGTNAYPLSAFSSLRLPPVKNARAVAPAAVNAVNGKRAVGVDELQAWAAANGKVIADHPLAVLAHGQDFDRTKYPSRSEALFAVLTGLVRASVPDDMILAAVTTDFNKASACVLDKRDPLGEAARQLANAHGAVASEGEQPDTILDEMNRLHAVVTSQRVRVLSFRRTNPTIDRQAPDLQSFEDFRNRYRHQQIAVGSDKQGNTVYKKKGDWWLDNSGRREILGLCFAPGEAANVGGFQNLWLGFGIEPAPGDWSLMRAHVHRVLASGDSAHADYIIKWAAWAVQNPEKQAEAALVFRGRQGTGKGFFGRTLKELFGQHGLHIKSAKHLTGDFNLHLRDCCLLFADEAIAPGDKGAESRLKGLITEDDLTIEGKGENLVTEPNHLHVVMASNEDWVVPAAADERRYAVFNVAADRQGDRDYFEALDRQLEDGGRAAMLHDLLALPLGDWHPRWNIPQTDALAMQKAEGLVGFEAFVLDMLDTDGWPSERCVRDYRFVSSGRLLEDAQKWLHRRPGVNHVTFNKIEQAMVGVLGCSKHRISGAENGYLLPDTDEMRHRWDEKRFPWAWKRTAPATRSSPEKPPF